MPSTFTAFFDANVFFGARLRSLVMEVAQSGVFRARWSPEVHDEWIRSVLGRRADLRREQIEPIRTMMDIAVPDALISGYAGLIPALTLPDPDDRHILAAAIVGRADVIVTFNEKDFPPDALAPYGIHTRHPDAFFSEAEGVEPGVLTDAAARDLAHYKRPPLSPKQYTDDLRKAGVPQPADYLWGVRVLLSDQAES
ncbi:PIN domain-containing protein [Methylobacterium sp. J-077]|uniref:PIN domain-containing protein n=1 Tax=Methylobacterium sp. J-077 TaxID=2836656 RepID=UPI001FBBF5B1|nr:PIN domain-containing protein [Methylobacterium sp. J-077]MCJ2126597.1 PIN domain-containing protein [Methylobacterium sp. J-077]